MEPLPFLTATEAASLIRRKVLSPVEYVTALLFRIEELNGQVNAFILTIPDAALAAARKAEDKLVAGGPLGPLHGVPFAVKDLFDVEGLPTTAHSLVLDRNIATTNADTVACLKSAGAILLGKLALEEFGIGAPGEGAFPPARNPWGLDRTPGGSSSGSGAALAAGFVPLTLGTDTGGSVRNPAAMCGVVGLKPTCSLLSMKGVLPLSASLDHVGVMTRTVEDNALLLRVLTSRDHASPTTVAGDSLTGQTNLRGLRMGLVRHFYVRDSVVSRDIVLAIEKAASVLAGFGADVFEVEVDPLPTYENCGTAILRFEGYKHHQKWLAERFQDYGATCRAALLAGARIPETSYALAQRTRARLREELAVVMQKCDVLVTAVTSAHACMLNDLETLQVLNDGSLRIPFNVTGNPALAIPVGYSSQGMPLAMQIVGKPHDEATVYRVGHLYQQATAWHRMHPRVPNQSSLRAVAAAIP